MFKLQNSKIYIYIYIYISNFTLESYTSFYELILSYDPQKFKINWFTFLKEFQTCCQSFPLL